MADLMLCGKVVRGVLHRPGPLQGHSPLGRGQQETERRKQRGLFPGAGLRVHHLDMFIRFHSAKMAFQLVLMLVAVSGGRGG